MAEEVYKCETCVAAERAAERARAEMKHAEAEQQIKPTETECPIDAPKEAPTEAPAEPIKTAEPAATASGSIYDSPKDLLAQYEARVKQFQDALELMKKVQQDLMDAAHKHVWK